MKNIKLISNHKSNIKANFSKTEIEFIGESYYIADQDNWIKAWFALDKNNKIIEAIKMGSNPIFQGEKFQDNRVAVKNRELPKYKSKWKTEEFEDFGKFRNDSRNYLNNLRNCVKISTGIIHQSLECATLKQIKLYQL